MKNYSLEQREVFDKPYYSVNVANLNLLEILQAGLKTLDSVKNVNISEGKRKHLTIYKQDFVVANEAKKQIKAYLDSFDDTIMKPDPEAQTVPIDVSNNTPAVSSYAPTKAEYLDKPDNCPTVFISHAWENDEHKQWILNFARDLTMKYGINVWCDYYNAGGTNLTTFMTSGIKRADRAHTTIPSPPYYMVHEPMEQREQCKLAS